MVTDIVNKIREFNRFYTSIIGVTNDQILKSNYSLTEARVMFEINHCPGITARKLKEIIGMDEGYLSRLIAKLEKQKIIAKDRSKDDNRIFALMLSNEGERIFHQINQRSSDAITELVQHLNEEEQLRFVQMLDSIKSLLTKNDPK